jgi:hypothetical protein
MIKILINISIITLLLGCGTNDKKQNREISEVKNTIEEYTSYLDTLKLIKPDNIVYSNLIPKEYNQILGKIDLLSLKGHNGHDTTDAANRTRLRNLGFCNCLNSIYPTFAKTYSDGSSGGFFMLSDYGVEIPHISKKLAKEFIKKRGIYNSYNPEKNLGVMFCLDYYNSKELNHFIQNWKNYHIENWED